MAIIQKNLKSYGSYVGEGIQERAPEDMAEGLGSGSGTIATGWSGILGRRADNCQLLTVNCQLSTVSCQLLAVSCQLSPVSCQLSNANFQLSAVKHEV